MRSTNRKWTVTAWVGVPVLLLGILCANGWANPGGDEKAPGRKLAQQATKAPRRQVEHCGSYQVRGLAAEI